jgi:hypothetical protein
MKLTWEETRDIANYLEDTISNRFHDALLYCLYDKHGDNFEVSDEDILRIKEQLKLIL